MIPKDYLQEKIILLVKKRPVRNNENNHWFSWEW